ncbi:hypothetical protein [Segetibacter sp. 3557_3]|uniref:hypothetical protein n=1 Tax=Segetibacter sp. 3557_3 TaxID=2547429 RepID=UPI001A9F40A9|nr:hypothetical protein [Segetibacter sp. 3557_3]
MENNATMPHMKSLALCLNKMVLDGYDDNFSATEYGLRSQNKDKIYNPEEVNIVNFFRFEGPSDPADTSIMYVIETMDGTKGTLVDAYGAYSDDNVTEFMKQVENIQKKTSKS